MRFIKLTLLFIYFLFALNCQAVEEKALYNMYQDEKNGIYVLYAPETVPVNDMVGLSKLFKKTFPPESKNNQYTTVFIFHKIIDFKKVLSDKNNRTKTLIEIGKQKPEIEYMGLSLDGNMKWASYESFCYIMNGQCVRFCYSNAYKDGLDYKYNYKETNDFREITPHSSIGDIPVCGRN